MKVKGGKRERKKEIFFFECSTIDRFGSSFPFLKGEKEREKLELEHIC